MPVTRLSPNLGPRLSIVTHEGKLVARLGGENGPGLTAGSFQAPHGIAVDSRGDIYVGEVSYTNWPTNYPDTPVPEHVRRLQNLVRPEEPRVGKEGVRPWTSRW